MKRALLLFLALLPAAAFAAQSDGNVFMIQGGRTTSASYTNWITINQPGAAGRTTSASYTNFIGLDFDVSAPPDCNIWQVDGSDFNAELPDFNYVADGNLTITFNVEDMNNGDLNFNMWYDTVANGKTNKIIGDINLSTDTSQGNCDTNARTGMVCHWDWNISGIADNNYWITIEIRNRHDTNTAAGQKSFKVNPAAIVAAYCVSVNPDANRNTRDSTPTFTATYSANLSQCGRRVYYNGSLIEESTSVISGTDCNYTHTGEYFVGEAMFIDFNAIDEDGNPAESGNYNRTGKLVYAGMPSNTVFLNSDSLSIIAIAMSSAAIILMAIVLFRRR